MAFMISMSCFQDDLWYRPRHAYRRSATGRRANHGRDQQVVSKDRHHRYIKRNHSGGKRTLEICSSTIFLYFQRGKEIFISSVSQFQIPAKKRIFFFVIFDRYVKQRDKNYSVYFETYIIRSKITITILKTILTRIGFWGLSKSFLIKIYKKRN